jgi:hypothetical protein
MLFGKQLAWIKAGVIVAAMLSAASAGGACLGLRSHYATAGAVIWVPVYLSNYSAGYLNSFSFGVTWSDAVVELDTIVPGREITPDWVLDYARPSAASAKVAIGVVNSQGFGENTEIELIRLKFRMSDNARPAEYSPVLLSGIMVNNGKVSDAGWTTPGKIIVASAPDSLGDVNADGEVDPEDAQRIIQCSSGENVVANAIQCFVDPLRGEVSGDGRIDSYDALLISQYVLGYVEDFPARSAAEKGTYSEMLSPTADYSPGPVLSAEFELSGPSPAGPGIFEYILTARNAAGIMAADIVLEIDSAVVKGVRSLSTELENANISGKFGADRSKYSIALFSNISETRNEIALVTITVIHAADQTVGGLGLASAKAYTADPSQGRNAPAGGVPPSDTTDQKVGAAMTDRRGAAGRGPVAISFDGRSSTFALRGGAGPYARLRITDMQGKTAADIRVPAAAVSAGVPALPAGRYLVRYSDDQCVLNRLVSIQK